MIQTYTTQLVHKKELAPDIYLFRFRTENGQKIQYQAGQYLILMVPQAENQMARRLYSILTPPGSYDYFDMVIEIFPNGLASQYLMKLNEHDEVIFQGPAGLFILKENDHPKVYLATGTGIVPIICMVDRSPKSRLRQDYGGQAEVESPKSILLWGVQTYKDLYLIEELKKLAESDANFSFKICLSREKNLDMIKEEDRKYFVLGRVTKGFEELASSTVYRLPSTDYYVCGGRTVVESLRQFLYEKGIPKESVHFEKF